VGGQSRKGVPAVEITGGRGREAGNQSLVHDDAFSWRYGAPT
jgi:hypothetical protein